VAIIAQAVAANEIVQHGDKILQDMLAYNQDKGEGTFVAPPTQTFANSLNIDLDDMPVQAISFGPAHSPGDISVWLPERKIIITGDITFHQRLLEIFPDTVTGQWVQSFEKMAALEPLTVIPAHGAPTDMAAIERDTLGYLKFLRGSHQDSRRRWGFTGRVQYRPVRLLTSRHIRGTGCQKRGARVTGAGSGLLLDTVFSIENRFGTICYYRISPTL